MLKGNKKPEPVKETPKTEKPKAEVYPPGVLLCECGAPVAPGQDQVCLKHIRTN